MSRTESSENQTGMPRSPAEERKKRLAEALRKNLRLRKARARNGDAAEAAGDANGSDESAR